jgi:hypothetical protein
MTEWDFIHFKCMDRKIPNLEHFSLSPIVGDNKTEENYKIQIYKFERRIEEHLIDIFKKLNMSVIVKTDPYSLPYNDEFIYSRRFSSYINDAYDYRYFSREVLKKIIENDLYKFRFYIYVDVYTPSEEFNPLGREVKYHFRYY